MENVYYEETKHEFQNFLHLNKVIFFPIFYELYEAPSRKVTVLILFQVLTHNLPYILPTPTSILCIFILQPEITP